MFHHETRTRFTPKYSYDTKKMKTGEVKALYGVWNVKQYL